MTALVPISDTLTNPAKVAALVTAMGATFPLITVRPETQALATTGLQAQACIDKIAVDLEVAPSLEIDSADSLAEAQEIAGRLAAALGILDDERKALGAPFFDLKKVLDEGYRQPCDFIRPVLDGVNRKVLAYNAQQRAIEAKRQRDEQERRDKEAADIRAKQAEADAAVRALVEQAAAATSVEAQQALLQQASEVADAGRSVAQQATASLTRVEFAPTGGKAKGVRETWEMEVVNSDEFFIALGKALEKGDHSLSHLAIIDQSAGNKQAALQRGAFNVPGLRASPKQSVINRKAAL